MSPNNARQVLEQLMPDAAIRRRWLHLVAVAIDVAHGVHPASWNITLLPNLIRLNVGKIETLVLRRGHAMLVLDSATFTEQQLQEIRVNPALGKVDKNPSVPGTVSLNVKYDQYKAWYAEPHGPLLVVIERAASRVQTRTTFAQFHSPGVIEYVAQETGITVPQPEYGAPYKQF